MKGFDINFSGMAGRIPWPSGKTLSSNFLLTPDMAHTWGMGLANPDIKNKVYSLREG